MRWAAREMAGWGYNTNGFAFHRIEDSIEILAELGYQAVGITLDHHVLDPYGADIERECARVRDQLERLGLRCVIETGARFLLDPRHKHQPTLVSPSVRDRHRRIDFLCRAIDVGRRLGAELVSFWSGAPIDDPAHGVWEERLETSFELVLGAAERVPMRLALEPEPGMLIDTLASAQSWLARFPHPLLGLTVDIGHLHCQEEGDIPGLLHACAGQLWNVHIEDMRRGVHDHLMFGAGEIDFPPVQRALDEIGYSGVVYAELSRHSHDAVRTAEAAIRFLQSCRPE